MGQLLYTDPTLLYSWRMEMQTCGGCARTLPWTPEHFYMVKSRGSLARRCKTCKLAPQKLERAANPDKFRALSKKNYHKRGGKETDRLYREKLRRDQPEAFKSRTKAANTKYKSKPAGYLCNLQKGVRSRALQNGVEYDLPDGALLLLFEQQMGTCAIFGIPLTIIVGSGVQDTNPSADRIDPSKGYVAGNVQIVCTLANRMKTSMDMPTFIANCKLVAGRF